MKKLITILFFFVFITGCGNLVQHTVSNEYSSLSPKTVTIMPIVYRDTANKEYQDISDKFRVMSYQKLRNLNYQVLPLESVDEKYQGIGRSWFEGKSYGDVANYFGTDAILYIQIKEWDKDRFVTYTALKMDARFEMYSATGVKLWEAEYTTKESDLRLEKKSIELALHQAYEPRIQRLIDAVFATLPPREYQKEQKSYFQWLP